MLILEQDAVYNTIIYIYLFIYLFIHLFIYLYKQFTSLSCSIPLDEHEMPQSGSCLAASTAYHCLPLPCHSCVFLSPESISVDHQPPGYLQRINFFNESFSLRPALSVLHSDRQAESNQTALSSAGINIIYNITLLIYIYMHIYCAILYVC